jgi:hypothetical protein
MEEQKKLIEELVEKISLNGFRLESSLETRIEVSQRFKY